MSKPEQAYGIISIASPDYFGPWKNFKKEFIVEQFQGNYTATIGAKNLSKLRNMIQDVMIRRTEYEVSVSLPKTVEIPINCPLDGTQNTLIFEINKKREELLKEFDCLMTQYNKNPNQGLYQRLQQTDAQIKGLIAATQATADDPRMFYMSSSQYLQKNFLQFVPDNYKQSSKMEKLVDIVDNIVNSGNKTIIFTKFRTSALLIREQLQKDLKLKSLLYTGKENEQQRDYNINLFKNDDDYKILIATEAGAEGLNLTVAKYVINFNLPDTAAIYTQRIGRIRRVSSTFNNVIVYNLLTEGSKDVERWDNIERNKNLEGALISVNEAQQEALINAMKKD
jgi:ERCC4-related helicase